MNALERSVPPFVARVALLLLVLAPPAHALRPERGYRATPADYGIICRELTIVTRDSIALRAWFYPAQDTAGIATDLVGIQVPVPIERRPAPRAYRAASGPSPTVVICDGDAGNMTDLIFHSCQLITRGFNVLTFDWRGFGDSAPWPLDPNRLCVTEFLADYEAVIDSALAQPEVQPGGIGVLGFSTGAYLSFAEAARRPEVRAFAGRALLTSFADLLTILKRLDPDRPWTAPADYPRDLLPVNAARRMRVPAFIVVGENDQRTPPWMSRQIAGDLRGPKQLWIVPGADHGGSKAPELVTYPEFFERLADFFRTYLSEPPGGRMRTPR